MSEVLDRIVKQKVAKQLPSFAGLLILIACALDAATQKLVDDYHAACCKWEKRWNGLLESLRQLSDRALDTPLRVTLDGAAKLNEERASLERELAELRWWRYSIVQLLVPFFQQALVAADAKYAAAIASEREQLASMGVTVDSMPAGGGANPEAAEIQLMHRIQQELGPLGARAEQTRAKSNLDVLYSQLNSAPDCESCKLSWPGSSAGIASDVARMAKLDSSTPTVQTSAPLSQRASRIIRECGLTDRPLLPQHEKTISAIDDVLPEKLDHFRPLSACSARELPKVRELLAKLPPTDEVKTFLAATKDGPVAHRV